MYNIQLLPHTKEQYIISAKTNRLMLFREITDVYCENYTKHTNTLFNQYAQFYYCHLLGD
jgi:hypothetical protein